MNKRVSYNKLKYELTTQYPLYNWLRNKISNIKYLFIPSFKVYSGTKTQAPFFIIGSGRSGNTLLRAIITVNSEIAIPPESYVLGPLVKKWSRINHLPWKDIVKIVIGEYESHHNFYTWDINFSEAYKRLYALSGKDRSLSRLIEEMNLFYAEKKFPNATRWGDKTPKNTFYLNWIRKLYPNAQFIHIIRDGRDVVKSYMNASFWKHGIKEAAIDWMEAVDSGIALRNLPNNRYFEIRYEDLVNNPEIEIPKICSFLNIQFDETMLTPYRVADTLGDSSKDYHTNLAKPISNKSVGSWEEFFNEEEKLLLNELLKEDLNKLGYS